MKREEHENAKRKVIADYNGCLAYDFESVYKNGPRHDREVAMYKTAMTIYCDLENGKAFENDYEWPEL